MEPLDNHATAVRDWYDDKVQLHQLKCPLCTLYREMLASLVGKSLLIRTADGEPTAEEHSQEKIIPRFVLFW